VRISERGWAWKERKLPKFAFTRRASAQDRPSRSGEQAKVSARHLFDAAVLMLVYAGFRVLPTDLASALGGWLGRTIGPRIRVSRRARRNLARAMPDLAPAQTERIVRAMWDNLGRTVGEFAHIKRIADTPERVEVINEAGLDCLRVDGRAGILFSGHLGNWEILTHLARRFGVDYAQVYRAPNNRIVDWFVRRMRGVPAEMQVPKGSSGARRALAVLRRGGRLGMLVDQKMNDGIAVPFFGHAAMTAPALAEFGLRYRCPLVPVRVERVGGCRFRITVHPPLALPDSGDRAADVHTTMATVNALLEDWIRARPEQWLWLHRRWPK
jgi:KDO2-lipid IV(A) lauroyltransferase